VELMLGNLRTKVLAAVLALALWGVVAYAENPSEQRTFLVPVQHTAPPKGLVVTTDPPPVGVTVVAPSDTLRNWDPRIGLRVTADFSTVKRGRNVISVQVDRFDPNVSIRRRPDPIVVEIDELGTVKRPVVVERLHKVPTGYHEVGTPAVTPAEVMLLGPQSQLAGAEAVVQVDLEGQQQSTPEQALTVLVRDQPGHKRLDRVSASPAQVAVKIVIQPDAVAETKPVVLANLVGQPAVGYRVANITITPLTVTATGLAVTLDAIPRLEADPVDITNASADVVRTVNLRVPTGVQEVSPRQVTVRVFIERNPQVPPGPTPTPTPTPRP